MGGSSKVVGVSTTTNGVVVVTEDGDVWMLKVDTRQWMRLPSVPNTPAAEDGN